MDESHTSKCSFLDNEPVGHYDQYLGRRIKRGLFKTTDGTLINADVNACYNLLEKSNPESFQNGNRRDRGCGLHPVKYNVAFNEHNLNTFNGL